MLVFCCFKYTLFFFHMSMSEINSVGESGLVSAASVGNSGKKLQVSVSGKKISNPPSQLSENSVSSRKVGRFSISGKVATDRSLTNSNMKTSSVSSQSRGTSVSKSSRFEVSVSVGDSLKSFPLSSQSSNDYISGKKYNESDLSDGFSSSHQSDSCMFGSDTSVSSNELASDESEEVFASFDRSNEKVYKNFNPDKVCNADNKEFLKYMGISEAQALFGGVTLFLNLSKDKDLLLSRPGLIAHCMLQSNSKNDDDPFDRDLKRNVIQSFFHLFDNNERMKLMKQTLDLYPQVLQVVREFCNDPESFDGDVAVMLKMALDIFCDRSPEKLSVEEKILFRLYSGLSKDDMQMLRTWNSSSSGSSAAMSSSDSETSSNE